MIDGTYHLAVAATDNPFPILGWHRQPALRVEGDFCWSTEH